MIDRLTSIPVILGLGVVLTVWNFALYLSKDVAYKRK
jgi:hypothetical protein